MISRTLLIVIQVTSFGILVGAIVAVCSVGFVSGVRHISNWRDEYSSCLNYATSYCFSAQPIFFLMVSACLIIFVKELSK